jgi:hypothetical protein
MSRRSRQLTSLRQTFENVDRLHYVSPRQLGIRGLEIEDRFIEVVTRSETVDKLPTWLSHFEAPEKTDDWNFKVDAWAVFHCGSRMPLQVKSTEKAAQRHAEELEKRKIGLILVLPTDTDGDIVRNALRIAARTARIHELPVSIPQEWFMAAA